MARIYLASSWRNEFQADTVTFLRNQGHDVYDFKSNVAMDAGGPRPAAFAWTEIDENWQSWSYRDYSTKLLSSPRAAAAYLGDLRGMEWADTCVLLLPSGRSAHIEAGYMKGRGKRLIIYRDGRCKAGIEPELMYLLADHICGGLVELAIATDDVSAPFNRERQQA